MITLDIIQLEKSFGHNTVFSDVTFNHRGSSLGISGSNGSGKSTLLKCLGNLLRPSSGEINWLKDDLPLDRGSFRDILGYAAPYINLYEELSCSENLRFLSRIRHDRTDDKQIEKWLEKVGLGHVVEQPYGKLSTGQRQRLRLASALFHKPEILMLDEPGSNLDEEGRKLVRDIAESYRSEEQMLIIASNSSDELALCEQVYSIEEEEFV